MTTETSPGTSQAPSVDPAAAAGPARFPQLNPAFAVAWLAPGLDPTAYTRQLAAALWPEAMANPSVGAALRSLTVPGVQDLTVPSHDEVAASVPRAASALRAKCEALQPLVSSAYPLLPGETVTESLVTVLLEPVGEMPRGTVVYQRTTDTATVLFFLPYLHVDMDTGSPTLALPSPTAPPKGTTGLIRSRGTVQAKANLAAVPGGVYVALQVAQTLVWALPPPWGPISAAGFTLIDMLIGKDAPSVGDLIQQAVTQLEDFITQQDINADGTHIKGFVDWLSQQQTVLTTTQVDNSAYINTVLLPELHSQTSPGGNSVYDAIYDLETHLDKTGVLDILMTGVSVYLLALKWIVQLDACLAATAKDNGDDAAFAQYTNLWLSDYANFLIATLGNADQQVVGWAARMSQHISDNETGRLSQITEPYRYDNQTTSIIATAGGFAAQTNDEWGWTYKDLALGDSDMTHFVADTQSGGDCCTSPTNHEHQSDVQATRDQHVTDVSNELTTTYANPSATIRQWAAAITQWNQHLPPRPPTTAVTPTKEANGPATPTGGNWVNGASVSYAIAFANQAGPSQPGPWSSWLAVGGTAYATLQSLPTDPLNMATEAWVYRRFKRPDGTQTPPQVVGMYPMTSPSYNDEHP